MFICPNCGEVVPDGASVCPHCGSDEETGWNPDAEYNSIELPEEEDNEDHGGERPGPSSAFTVFLIILGLLGLIAYGGVRSLAHPIALLGMFARRGSDGAPAAVYAFLFLAALVVYPPRDERLA